nr:Uma2 family endonuclease [Kribbella qitaiheensis]
MLAIEVVSPRTRVTDVVLERARYEQHGIPSYWLLDPDRQELTVLRLTNTTYTCQTIAQGGEPFPQTPPSPSTSPPPNS